MASTLADEPDATAASGEHESEESVLDLSGDGLRGIDDTVPLSAGLLELCLMHNRITVIDSVLSAAQMQELMAGCDAFLSLHRSEGFGLGPAEAMAQGKAVVASAYGGVCDFVNEQTAYPVPCIERLIAEGEYVHADGQVWGEPDIDAAVAALRRVYDAPEDVASKASAGFELLQRQHSFAAVGARMLERLEYLGMLD